jgi:pimeloyl-ACP methyl ester carboxylesterase
MTAPTPRALRALLIFVAVALLSACATRQGPDLTALYARAASNPSQPPVIVIPGLMGSTLRDTQTGEELWPGSLSDLAFSDYARLARMGPEWEMSNNVAPGTLIRELGGVDIYGQLLGTLEGAGRFREGEPGKPIDPLQRRRYYTLAYDWRQPNIVAVRQLHALIDQIRRDYADPGLRIDIIAHSNGGLIANYYLRYGPIDVLEEPIPKAWEEGRLRVRRVAMLGTPNLGSVISLQRLLTGFRFSLRTVPIEALASFSTVFETLPHPHTQVILDTSGRVIPLDVYDPVLWRDNRWSVFSPEVEARTQEMWGEGPQAQLALGVLQANFERNLRRGKRFTQALALPFPSAGIRMAVFGGDCELTRSAAVLETIDGHAHLAFSPRDITKPVKGVDYAALMEAPGDGLVTRESQDAAAFGFVPARQTFFLCENHGRLLANPFFQNNLLNFILSP